MPDRKPTPIRRRASAPKSEPKPLIFPPPNRDITVADMHPVPIVTKEQVARLMARLIYKIAARVLEPDITEMGEAQFEAFCLSLMEDMD